METNEPLARFLLQVARAAEQLAAELTTGAAPAADVKQVLGKRQGEAMTALRTAGRDLSTGEVASMIGYDFSNCYMTMRRLEQLRLVQLIPGSRPQRWRLGRAAAG